jgi:hypothetical protein
MADHDRVRITPSASHQRTPSASHLRTPTHTKRITPSASHQRTPSASHLAQVDPLGVVPSSTKTALSFSHRVPLFHTSVCFVRSKSRGIFWKQSSVNGWSAGQRRYWYPPYKHQGREMGGERERERERESCVCECECVRV